MPVATPLPAPCCGCDTIAGLNDAAAAKLAATDVFQGTDSKCKFLWQYVSLHAPNASDVTVAKIASALKAGLIVCLVQHVENPGWHSSLDNGVAHGQAAVAHCQLVSYPKGCHVALDMEGLANAGQSVIEYVTAWAAEVHAAGYLVCVYVGYSAGLSPTQMAALADKGVIDVFWSDFGSRTPPPGYGFAMIQSAQRQLPGFVFYIDPDRALKDLKGRVIVGMGHDPTPIPVPDPGVPHFDPEGVNFDPSSV